MLLVEFEKNINENLFIIRYKNINTEEWYFLYIDIETLNLLLQNFGIISMLKIPTLLCSADNPMTGPKITIKYFKAEINMNCYYNHCKNKALRIIEQNY